MSPSQYDFQCGFRLWVALEDSKCFVGPADFTALNTPSKAPGLGQSLRLSQVGLTAPQLILGLRPSAALGLQYLIGLLDFLDLHFQIIARALERFRGASLRHAQRPYKQR